MRVKPAPSLGQMARQIRVMAFDYYELFFRSEGAVAGDLSGRCFSYAARIEEVDPADSPGAALSCTRRFT